MSIAPLSRNQESLNRTADNQQRRKYPRSDVDHAAVVLINGQRYPDCRIRNFSEGGLFIQIENVDSISITGSHKNHALIDVPCSDQDDGPRISLGVSIAYAGGAGLGVRFFKPQPRLIACLQKAIRGRETGNISVVSPTAAPASANRQPSAQVIDQLGRIGGNFMRRELPDFFPLFNQRLLEETDRALSANEQEDIFRTLKILEEKQIPISLEMAGQLASGIREWSTDQQAQTADQPQLTGTELELVEKEDFDEWVIIVDIARITESTHQDQLHQLLPLLNLLVSVPFDKDSNPFSPYSLLWLLQKTLQPYELPAEIKGIGFRTFGDTLLNRIGELYQELLDYLAQQGVTGQQVSAKPSAAPEQATRPARRKGKKSVLETLSSLLSFGQGQGNGAGDQSTAADGRTAARQDIIRQLEGMPAGSAGSGSVVDYLEQQLTRHHGAQGATAIDGKTRAAIGATEQLLSSLGQELHLGSPLQGLVNQLEIPLIKEAIDDPGLLNNDHHPARQLLESIGRLAPYSSADATRPGTEVSLYQALQQIGDACANGEITDISQVTQQIEALLERQKEAFERNLSLVVNHSEQEQKTLQQGEKVRHLLTDKLSGQSVAGVFDQLLKFGWPAILLRTSEDSSDLKPYLSVIDFMLSAFAEEKNPEPLEIEKVDQLRQVLTRGFASYPLHLDQTTALVKQITHGLERGGADFLALQQDRVRLDPDHLQALFLQQIPGTDGATAENPSLDGIDSTELSLENGDWITERLEQGRMRLLSLAWKDPSGNRFVFVDGHGMKVLDCDAATLNEHFQSQKYSRLESGELPLVERAVHRALKQGYSQVKNENEIDQLTGLMNRRSFERKIDALLRSASGAFQHVLLLFDLDRFNMINDICGFEGGDHLLQTVTDMAASLLHTEAHLARIGDDEFGILLENCSLDKGYLVAESQRQALESYKFSWQGKTTPVTVSIGIVSIDTDGSASSLIKNAASACSLAKRSGRNCSRVYQALEQDFADQRRLVKSIPVIEEALEQNRIALHSQLISPLFSAEGNDHYEILLRVVDQAGKPGSPEDFIRAAERYDRMRSIDRWVINAFFSWLGDNGSLLGDIGGFSMNLSGQSMSDEQTMALLQEKIRQAPIAADKIGIEITETSLLTDTRKTNLTIESLKKATGCKFYLDDFGSGYASYAYLKDLSVDVVKVDGIFVKDILQDKSSRAMVKSIVDIAHYMDKKVIAEFAETEAHLIELRELDVDFAQGYAIGRPAPLEKLVQNGSFY